MVAMGANEGAWVQEGEGNLRQHGGTEVGSLEIGQHGWRRLVVHGSYVRV